MSARVYLFCAALAYACCLGQCSAQLPWSLDTAFRINSAEKGVSSLIILPDARIIASGGIRFPGDPFLTPIARFNSDGSRDLNFFESGFGGARLALWNDRFYAQGSTTIQRFLMDGHFDTTFIEMNSDPYFSSLQGGDFHVFPDGRLLICGTHLLDDTMRGFVGPYNLIWFTNQGQLDTSRTHRACDGSTRQIEPLVNGQFLVSGIVTECEGQPVGRIFRINEDGSLDPTLQTSVNWGSATAFLPLTDGRFYAGGVFRIAGSPNDTLRLVRFMPNGGLDPSFNAPNFTYSGQPNPGGLGPFIASMQYLPNGNLLVTGGFQKADGEYRRGICVLDTTGGLLEDFTDAGVGLYFYNGFPQAEVRGYTPLDDGMAYIHGYYHGYNDGSTNDTLQRFVTRLYGPDFTTAVSEVPATDSGLTLFPNPTTGRISFTYAPSGKGTQVVVQDLVGRMVQQRNFPAYTEQFQLDLGGLAQGTYMLRLLQGERTLGVRQVLVQD